MQNLFSHAPEPDITEAAETAERASSAVYLRSEMPVSELWTAFTEYTHLWWPHSLKREADSYIEFGEAYLLEEEEAGDQHILAETAHLVPEDVIAVRPSEKELKEAFRSGLSFVFDVDGAFSLLEVSSGVVSPREVGDSELGILEPDLQVARELLGCFARFIQAELIED